MKFKNSIAITISAVLLSGALFTGIALAAGENSMGVPIAAMHGDRASLKTPSWVSELSEGGQATFKQLTDLRQSHMEKLKSESEALINQAVAAGTITQEQADRLLARGAKAGGKHGAMPGKPGRGGKRL